MTLGAARACGLLREHVPRRPPPVLSRGHRRGKQQSESDASWSAGRVSHPARPLSARQHSRHTSRRLSRGPPTASILPNRRRSGYDRGPRRRCRGGRTLNGRSRLRGDVTRRCTCRTPIPAAFLPLPWFGVDLVRNLQPLFRSPSSPAAGIGLRDEEGGCGGLKAILLHSRVRAWVSLVF